MAKILVVDDDKSIARALCDLLQHERHEVESVHTGDEALDRLRFYSYDAIILDWQLPGLSGVEILRAYRLQGGRSPVLMLTGMNRVDDKEEGFDSGADDYLTKPFDMREFLARVKALLRRPSAYTPVRQGGDFGLDANTFEFIRRGEKIKLLPKEFAVMEFLMRHSKQYILPEQILNQVWPDESESTIDALRTCIKRIRQKIDKNGEESLIQSSRGYGYKFEPPV